MKTRVVTSQSRLICDRLKTGAIAPPLIALSALILSGCSLANLPSSQVGAASPKASPTIGSSPIAASSPTNEFGFPQANCGDKASTPNENWYPVYIDHGDLEEIHSKFCGDAISTLRDKSGTPSVQVASFTSYGKAQRFAAAVGGVVEAVPTAQSPSPDLATADRAASPASSPSSAQSPTGTQSPSGTQTAKSATLAAGSSGSPINIRSSASTTANIASVGYGGDRLQIVDKTQGDDGYTWYSVRLESGETGWVRGDFVSEQTASAASSSAASGGSASDRAASIRSDRETASTATSNPSASADSSTSAGSSAGQTATLAASEPGSPINVRDRASTTADVRSVGYAGDRIQIADKAQGDDGTTWYSVRFESGQTGWVRSDFVNR